MSGHVDVGEVRVRLAGHLGEKAYTHSVAVADTAVRIAEAYGLDSDDAYLAGLLHDWAREDGAAHLLETAADLGIQIAEIDRTIPYLLHAPVGAAQVAAEFPGLGADICAAISAHTVGSEEMDDLARAVYIADMIEPHRRFDGVEALRSAVGTVSLAELFARAYAASVTHLLATRRHLHPRTVAVWNAIAAEGDRR